MLATDRVRAAPNWDPHVHQRRATRGAAGARPEPQAAEPDIQVELNLVTALAPKQPIETVEYRRVNSIAKLRQVIKYAFNFTASEEIALITATKEYDTWHDVCSFVRTRIFRSLHES